MARSERHPKLTKPKKPDTWESLSVGQEEGITYPRGSYSEMDGGAPFTRGVVWVASGRRPSSTDSSPLTASRLGGGVD